MKNTCVLICAAVVLLLGCFHTRAAAREVALEQGMGTFEVPDDFIPLSAEEMKKRYGEKPPSKFVVWNEARVATITYEVKNRSVPIEQIQVGLESMVASFERAIPELRWEEKKIVELSGQNWALLEFIRPGRVPGKDFRSFVIFTPHRERILMFTFEVLESEFPKAEKALRGCIASIKLS